MKKNLTVENLDSTLLGILDDNKDLVELQKQKAELLPKFCQRCDKDLKDYKECRCKDDVVRPGEYMTWTSVADDVGALTYDCYECVQHYRLKPHMPGGKPCNECNRLRNKRKMNQKLK